jgi:hypothetical protein
MLTLNKLNKINKNKNHKKIKLIHMAKMIKLLSHVVLNCNQKLHNLIEFKRIMEISKFNQQKIIIVEFHLL